jgi:hypothetical protein
MLERLPVEFGALGGRRTVALIGEGGVGKSSVALEYCSRRRSDYDVVVWLHAEQPSRLAAEYAAMAAVVGLPPSDQEASRASFFEWLQTNGRWLTVFDNAAGPEELRAFVPDTIHGDVIVTSRNAVWDQVARQLRVEPLTHPDAMRYLLEATASDDVASAADMVVLSGGNARELGLAVRRVAAGDTLANYVAELRARVGGSR